MCIMEVSEATEIRKIPSQYRAELARILDDLDNWKTLMSKIPKTLNKDSFECATTFDNLPKYISEHYRLIEEGSKKTHRSCTEILFDEWGCSGRVRPSVGHLFFLLKAAQLYRAADYVAKDILNQEIPTRPNYGPLAPVKINTSELRKIEDPEIQNIERILDDIDYPSSAIEQIRNSMNRNSTGDSGVRAVPEIRVTETPSSDSGNNYYNFVVPVDNQNVTTENNVGQSHTDMIKFSQSDISRNRPPISLLLNDEVQSSTLSRSSEQSGNLPNLTELNISPDNPVGVQPNASPNISDLLRTSSKSPVDEVSGGPPFSSLDNSGTSNGLSNSSESYLPDFDAMKSSSKHISNPNSSQFLPATLNPSTVGHGGSESEISLLKDIGLSQIRSQVLKTASDSRQCSSPLPNLSLNTHLPHFTYAELEVATNNFDETPYRKSELHQDEFPLSTGRFLGSGAFGSVFLALGILNRPVAVKRINLKDLNIVKADDFVTKQFKNEVEVLCRYKHDNLLSLVGYSCDGLTYCLLYEYIPGGNLKERLENTGEELIWTQRLHIAMGTARGISYLHTGYSNPLIHRDIKTANILLDATNKPKLCDFGIVRISSPTTTGTSHIFGTSAYMPPEAHRGDVSEKLDTFSFGVVLLELLTGLPPLDYNRAGADLITHVQESLGESDDITLLLDKRAGTWASKNVNFAKELYGISMKCLQEKKNLRPKMTQITELLAELLQRF